MRRQGFVLVTVLMLVGLLTVVLLRYNYASQTAWQACAATTQREQALLNARTGLHITLATLSDYNPETRDLQLPEGSCHVRLIPESGKLNLNALLTPGGQPDRERIEILLRLIDWFNQHNPKSRQDKDLALSYAAVPALLDWIDPDDQVTVLPWLKTDARGAEDPYYQALTPPRHCADEPMTHVGELALVATMDTGSLYTNIEDLAGEEVALADCLTVHGQGLIDLNEAQLPLLQCLAPNISPALARAIHDRRGQKRFESMDELKRLPGMADETYMALRKVAGVGTERSELNDDDPPEGFSDAPQGQRERNVYYTVTATGRFREAQAAVTAMVEARGAGEAARVLWLRQD